MYDLVLKQIETFRDLITIEILGYQAMELYLGHGCKFKEYRCRRKILRGYFDVFLRLRMNVLRPKSSETIKFIKTLAGKIIEVDPNCVPETVKRQYLERLIVSITTTSREVTIMRILNPQDYRMYDIDDTCITSAAAAVGNLDAVKAIQEQDTTHSSSLLFLGDPSPYPRLPEMRNPLREAASTGQAEVLQYFLSKVEAYLLNHENNRRLISLALNEALRAAVLGSHSKVVKLLFDFMDTNYLPHSARVSQHFFRR
jgi:hypothetical protein